MTNPLFDVLIIGGGPAGLAVALGLARQVYSAVVFDGGEGRGTRASHMHNLAGWQHQELDVFISKARADLLERYKTIRFEQTVIRRARKALDGQFEAIDEQGRSWMGRKLVLANGAAYVLPSIVGYEDCWGHGIYSCLLSRGYEDKGVPSAGVLCTAHAGEPSVALHLSRMARRFTKRVTLYTDGADELAEQLRLELRRDKDGLAGLVRVNNQAVARLARGTWSESEVVVNLSDGSEVTEGFLVHKPFSQAKGPFSRQLALELVSTGDIKTTQPFHETSQPGVFAVGDCATATKSASQAAAMGALAAGGLVYQLGAELAKTA